MTALMPSEFFELRWRRTARCARSRPTSHANCTFAAPRRSACVMICFWQAICFVHSISLSVSEAHVESTRRVELQAIVEG